MAKKKKGGSSAGSMRDRMRERATTREQQGRGGVKFKFPEGQEVKFLKIDKAGTKKLDFLPYTVTDKKHPAGVAKGDLWYQRTIWTHNGVGPEEKSYLCLKSVGKKCPICDYAAQLQRDPKADEELVKSLRAKEREIFNVIDLGGDPDEILFWEFSYHLFGKLLEEEIRNAEDEEDYKAGFADLEGGSTLKVRFDSKKMGKNEFFEAKRIDFLERDDYDEEILERVLPLDEILNIFDYEKLEAIFLDTDPGDDEEDEEDEKPKKGAKKDDKKKSSSRRGKDEEEEEDEEEKPSRRSSKKEEKSSKKKSKEVDLDDMDLDELREYIEEHDLDIKVGKKMDEDDVRELILEALANGEEEPEDEEPPKRGRGSKKEEKPAKKGKKQEDDEEEEEDDKPSRRGKKEEKKPAKKSSKKDEEEEDEQECIGGGTFGEDEGEFDECIDCDCWDECKAASAAKKKGKKRR